MEVSYGQLDDLRKDIELKFDKRFDIIEQKFETVNKAIESKVSFATFTWVFGISMLIIITLFGVIWSETKETRKATQETNNATVRLEAQWDQWTK